jgi:hypothetical protein
MKENAVDEHEKTQHLQQIYIARRQEYNDKLQRITNWLHIMKIIIHYEYNLAKSM